MQHEGNPEIDRGDVSGSALVIFTSVLLVAGYNFSFFIHIAKIYPVTLSNIAFLISLVILIAASTILLLAPFCYKYTIKPVLILILLASSLSAYFMDSYNLVIDSTMINSAVNTNIDESLDLVNYKLVLYFVLLGILPSVFIYRARINKETVKKALFSKLLIITIAITVIVVVVMVFSKSYASFFREHKPLRSYINPTYYLYSAGKYINSTIATVHANISSIEDDSKIIAEDIDRELVIMVIGETARADRFSLNGYSRNTNPLLAKEDVINLSKVYSCGTSTADSVPCMFSLLGHDEFSIEKAAQEENALDVLSHAGVNIIWRDNNSDSKGVALRVPYVSYKNADTNSICDIECRDEGMLVGLQEYIDTHKGDILIVLHQMGNHGPAYYKRYPTSFERFSPACRTNHLDDCSLEEINNAYDNAILYTDYFLSKVIGLLKKNDNKFETAMFYISDHGESLGENGLYLHGLPYFIAPDTQKHVPAILWLGKNYEIDKDDVKRVKDSKFSHDNVFHTLLGLFEIESEVYNINMDIIHKQ